jgi:hypothetical protein
MAGPGRAPKQTLSRPRDDARRQAQFTTVADDGEVRGPELPESFEWPPQTHHWWQTWRESAQAQTFTGTDWDFLLDTAALHADFWLGDRSVAAELRLRAAKFGATPEDRLRLKLEVAEPGDRPSWVPEPSARQAGNRKARLRKVAG